MAKGIQTIKNQFQIIQNETIEDANTANRVGGAGYDLAEFVEGLAIGQTRKEGVDTYNDTSDLKTSLLNSYPTPEKGWAVLVRNDETNGGKATLYQWNGTNWINLETVVYNDGVATIRDSIGFNISAYAENYDIYSKSTARLLLPVSMRKRGCIITYKLSDGNWYTEQFTGATGVTDLIWSNDSYWTPNVVIKDILDYSLGCNVSAVYNKYDYTLAEAVATISNQHRKNGFVIQFKNELSQWVQYIFENPSNNNPSNANWLNINYWTPLSYQKAKPTALYGILNNWLVSFNDTISNASFQRLLQLRNAVKEILIDFPEEKPSDLDSCKLYVRNISVTTGTTAFRLAWYNGTDADWDNSLTLSFNITDLTYGGIKKIESTSQIRGKTITATLYLDIDLFKKIDNTNDIVFSSHDGILLLAEIRESKLSLFDLSQFENQDEGKENIESATLLDIANLRKLIFQPRYIDVLPYLCSSNVTKSKIGLFTPVAKTSTTLTFSANDALDFDIEPMPLALKISDTDYRIAYFSKSVNNTITLIHSFDELDLTKVESCMAIHDTIQGGQGQHLSPWGYRAFAQYIVDKLNDTSCLADNLLKSYLTERCQLATGYQDKRIIHADGRVLCEPTVNSLWKTGGNTGIVGKETGATIVNGCRIERNSNNRFGFNWQLQAYNMVQGVAGAYIDFPINAEFDFKGFLKVGIVNPIQGDYDGKARMIVFSDKEEIYNEYISPFMDNVIVNLQDKFYKNLTVRFLITEDKNTKVVFNYMALYREYTNKLFPITDKSVVAILGSSNTQYPLPNAPYIDIIEGDADNEVITRPDDSIGDGYGYYPKHIARLTGATVENWGMNGQTTFWGLDQLDKMFSTKKYTHIILTLFGNDLNGGIEKDVIIDNILRMCNYAIAQGCRPYVIMSYGTASSTQTYNYGRLHDMLIEGLY